MYERSLSIATWYMEQHRAGQSASSIRRSSALITAWTGYMLGTSVGNLNVVQIDLDFWSSRNTDMYTVGQRGLLERQISIAVLVKGPLW
jgi:hypothetical protein